MIRPPENSPESEGELLGRTLNSKDSLGAALCLYKVADDTIKETLALFEIGKGLNGLPGALHGGMVATLLDEACGIFTSTLLGNQTKHLIETTGPNPCAVLWPSHATATIYLNVTYLKFVKTPAVIAIRAWLKERSGRKLFVSAQLEDKDGNVLAKAESLFIIWKDAKL